MAAAEAAVAVGRRTRADPALSGEDLADPLEKYMEEMQSRNLHKLIAPPATVGWKSAVPVSWLVRLERLYGRILDKARNGVLTNNKVKRALEIVHAQGNINETKLDDSILMDQISDHLRMGLAHLRTLKMDKAVLDRASRKASRNEITVIHRLKIQIEEDAAPPAPALRRGNASLELVHQTSFGSTASGGGSSGDGGADATRAAEGADAGLAVDDPMHVFRNVLQQQESSEDEDKKHGPAHDSSSDGEFAVPGLKLLVPAKKKLKKELSLGATSSGAASSEARRGPIIEELLEDEVAASPPDPSTTRATAAVQKKKKKPKKAPSRAMAPADLLDESEKGLLAGIRSKAKPVNEDRKSTLRKVYNSNKPNKKPAANQKKQDSTEEKVKKKTKKNPSKASSASVPEKKDEKKLKKKRDEKPVEPAKPFPILKNKGSKKASAGHAADGDGSVGAATGEIINKKAKKSQKHWGGGNEDDSQQVTAEPMDVHASEWWWWGEDGGQEQGGEEEEPKESDTVVEPPPPDDGLTRSQKRHKVVSRAYHIAWNEHRPRGEDEDNAEMIASARAKAKAAHKKAGEAFDAENPRT